MCLKPSLTFSLSSGFFNLNFLKNLFSFVELLFWGSVVLSAFDPAGLSISTATDFSSSSDLIFASVDLVSEVVGLLSDFGGSAPRIDNLFLDTTGLVFKSAIVLFVSSNLSLLSTFVLLSAGVKGLGRFTVKYANQFRRYQDCFYAQLIVNWIVFKSWIAY